MIVSSAGCTGHTGGGGCNRMCAHRLWEDSVVLDPSPDAYSHQMACWPRSPVLIIVAHTAIPRWDKQLITVSGQSQLYRDMPPTRRRAFHRWFIDCTCCFMLIPTTFRWLQIIVKKTLIILQVSTYYQWLLITTFFDILNRLLLSYTTPLWLFLVNRV